MASSVPPESPQDGFEPRQSVPGSTEGSHDATHEHTQDFPATYQDEGAFNVLDVQGKLSEWLDRPEVQDDVKRMFDYILRNTDECAERVQKMALETSPTLYITFSMLADAYSGTLAQWLIQEPNSMFPLLNEAATEYVLEYVPDLLAMTGAKTVFVRLRGMPVADTVRNLRMRLLDQLLKVGGVVTKRSLVFPRLESVKFDCKSCGFLLGPFVQRNDKEIKLDACPSCRGKGPFTVNVKNTVYRDWQLLTLQESPGQVPAGRLPRRLEVVLQDDLKDTVKPGDEVEITGVYKTNYEPLQNHKAGFTVFTVLLEANCIEHKTEAKKSQELSDDDKKMILALSKQPDIKDRIVKSIAPSIHGLEDIKFGLALALFGGVQKDGGVNNNNKVRTRGDINVLLLGDPGTAKSQMLKFCEKTAGRAVYTTGKGSTAVGLTAAMHIDPTTGEWALEGGAMVLADRGVCLIDEFDKMNEADRTSIHEAMEQQTISIAKAGIVATLQARCTVIAAANPKGGRYNSEETFENNVEMTQSILQRFDLLFILRDSVDQAKDYNLARFVCDSHTRHHPHVQKEVERLRKVRAAMEEDGGEAPDDMEPTDPADALVRRLAKKVLEEEDRMDSVESDGKVQIPQDVLRKYILYAKSIQPSIQNVDANKFSDIYAKLRNYGESSGASVAPRHFESLVRLSEAHARMHLRSFVSEDDQDAAIELFLHCFGNTQKFQHKSNIQRVFSSFIRRPNRHVKLLMHILGELFKPLVHSAYFHAGRGAPGHPIMMPISDLVSRAAEHGVWNESLVALYANEAFIREYYIEQDHIGLLRFRPGQGRPQGITA